MKDDFDFWSLFYLIYLVHIYIYRALNFAPDNRNGELQGLDLN